MTSDDRRARLPEAGRWLQEQRKPLYPTAVGFARALGIDPSMVSNYERGINSIDDERAVLIAKVLRIDIIEVRRRFGLWVPDEGEPASGVGEPREEALTQAEQVAGVVMDLMVAKGLDVEARQRREIELWSEFLIKSLDLTWKPNAS